MSSSGQQIGQIVKSRPAACGRERQRKARVAASAALHRVVAPIAWRFDWDAATLGLARLVNGPRGSLHATNRAVTHLSI